MNGTITSLACIVAAVRIHLGLGYLRAVDLVFDKKWRDLIKRLGESFDGLDDIQSVVFLIGLQEAQQEPRNFKKDEKLELMHVGICVLLEPYGYYKPLGLDKEGWPHFERVQELPGLSTKEQERFLQEVILNYFEEQEV